MEIKKYEFNKVFKSPIVIALLLIFIIYNGVLIFNNRYIRGDLQLTNELIGEFGYKVNDDMLAKVGIKYEKGMTELNAITLKKFNKEYKGIEEFINSEEFLSANKGSFTENEINLLDKLAIMNIYKTSSVNLIREYESINIMEIAEEGIKAYGLKGNAAEVVRKNYSKLATRVEKLKENGEHKNIYFLGKIYRTHKLLFKDVLRTVIFEIMILSALITAFLINYERDNRTELLVASTKRGRNLIKDKLYISSISTLIVSATLIGLTLLIYFTVFDYSQVWNVPISSALNWELAPMISWYNVTFIEYLIMVVVVIVIASIIFTGIDFVISSFSKSSYLSFFIFFIVFGVFCMIQQFIGKEASLVIYSNLNVFIMILNPNMWFGEAGPILTINNYEFITLISNFIIVGVLGILAIKRYKRESIV